jgi:flagellar hook-associated protein 3 FlgL
MIRVATFALQQSALVNIQRAQVREAQSGDQVSTGRKADDLKGFGRSAENVTALRSVKARVDGWLEQANQLSGKLEVQTQYLDQMLQAAGEARTAIGDALSSDHSEGLLSRVTAAFEQAANALNGRHEGHFLFAGARLEETPFAAQSMAELTTLPPASTFNNDQTKSATRLDDATVVQTGELASEIGGPLVAGFRAFQAFMDANAPLGSLLTAAQKTALNGLMQGFASAQDGVTQTMVRAGVAERKVEDVTARLDARAGALEGLLSDRTDVDPFRAIAEFNQAQLAVQATAKVFSSLRGTSLLDLLR